MNTPPIAIAKQNYQYQNINFLIDEILTEPWNENNILNDSILLFPSTDKQDVSPMDPKTPSKFLGLIFHWKKLGQSRRQKCTTEDLSDGCGQFMLVILISCKDRELRKSFNDWGYHMNKTDKSSNNNTLPASYNQCFLKPLCSQTSTFLNLTTIHVEPNCENPPMSVQFNSIQFILCK